MPVPGYSKAYSRLGTALFYEGNYNKAVENYAQAVDLDPSNEGYRADLKAAEEKLRGKDSLCFFVCVSLLLCHSGSCIASPSN